MRNTTTSKTAIMDLAEADSLHASVVGAHHGLGLVVKNVNGPPTSLVGSDIGALTASCEGRM